MRGPIATLLSVLFTAPAARAHEEPDTLMGVVVSVEEAALELRTVDGGTIAVRLGPETRYLKDDQLAAAADLRVGMRVVVDAAPADGGERVAREVRLGVVAPLREAETHGSEAEGAEAEGAKAEGGAPEHATHGGAAHGGEAAKADGGAAMQGGEAGAHGEAAMHGGEAAKAHGAAMHGGEAAKAHGAAMHGGDAGAHGEAAMHGDDAGAQGEAAMHGGDAEAQGEATRRLFQSDMGPMAGMSPRDRMGDAPLPEWTWMTAGVARLAFNRQEGPSGDEALESSNWGMVMARRDIGPGRFTAMAMLSLEPFTLEDGGSPQLFQTGETFEGRPLVDRQHAHDLLMNLSATFRAPIGERAAWWVQLAPRGEPALGPTAFMHRASTGENPGAALGHHLQDSTHITDMVATTGAGWRRVSVEASVFRGREPDEERLDLDPGVPDSFAGRLRVEPWGGWSAQVSYGFLKEPEALEPGDLRRTTVSLHYGAAGDRPFAATALWGRNREEHGTFDAVLLEAAYALTAADQLYGRAERVYRDRLILETKAPDDEAHDAPEDPALADVRALTLGYFRDVVGLGPARAGAGADVTFHQFPDALRPVYGESPIGLRAFLRLRWDAGHEAAGHGAGH